MHRPLNRSLIICISCIAATTTASTNLASSSFQWSFRGVSKRLCASVVCDYSTAFFVGVQSRRRRAALPSCYGSTRTTTTTTTTTTATGVDKVSASSSRASTASRQSHGSLLHRKSLSRQFPLTQVSSSILLDPTPPENDDLFKWERMYEEGEKSNVFGESEDIDPKTATLSEVRVVTFDLDNTLWKTSETISAANDALASYLADAGIDTPTRVEIVMKDLFKADKARYCPDLRQPDNEGSSHEEMEHKKNKIKSPVLLTQFRKDAIREILIRHNNYTTEDALVFTDGAFDVWMKARMEAIPLHSAKRVVECIEKIRQIRTSDGHPVIVGAITDGNSDPRNVPGKLGEYFDFCINSESVGVAKPDRRVYSAAIAEVANLPALVDVFAPDVEEDLLEDQIGPWWVHIGDDFLKDVVAAKELKMRSIWVRELVQPPKEVEEPNGESKDSQSKSKKKRNVEDLVKELSEMKVVEMSIGAEDFLLDSFQREFADAVVDEFHELSSVLTKWHEEGLTRRGEVVYSKGDTTRAEKSNAFPSSASESVFSGAEDILTIVEPDKLSVSRSKAMNTAAETISPSEVSKASPSPSPAVDTKFCVFCGAKLPAVAKFCSSCGEKQP